MTRTIFKTPDIQKGNSRTEVDTQRCAHAECDADGLYRAPRSRDNLRDYIWLCLEHVRAYNRQWNYFEGVDEDGMEEAIRRSATWERPSWKFGTSGSKWSDDNFDDPLGLFGVSKHSEHSDQGKPALNPDECRAFDIFGLTPCADAKTMKKRYKELAKAHHPDANGGSRKAEDRLKMINWAYNVLKPLITSRAS
jgi:hypothetical protein